MSELKLDPKLDVVETSRAHAPSTVPSHLSTPQPPDHSREQRTAAQLPLVIDAPNDTRLTALKRSRSDSLVFTPNKKGKAKENTELLAFLYDLEDDLTCPMYVLDTLLKPPSCVTCRAELSEETPVIPNFAMDATIEKHIAVLGKNGIEEWKPGGSKYQDRQERKQIWRKIVAERTQVAKTKVVPLDLTAYANDLNADYVSLEAATSAPRRRRRTRRR
ncbi:hypothetical protein H0H81_005543 [Sphagnurus paluster]|uniref:Uncharacterized protein n=1 Tax=Sphagnurus paluster TaxID=117069 RepID=A0A9P7GLJ2_9AGAR|nr:hypothetical protein H0H81_005543 [Sphagnurus paluster]